LAARYGHEAVVKLLLEKGAEPEAKCQPFILKTRLAVRPWKMGKGKC
jgi:hypothetical protein